MKKPDISVVVPVYNEEQNILPLYIELKGILDKLKRSYEIIFVDDGSRDNTLHQIKSLSSKDKKVKFISFMRNFQKAAAYMAGFEKAQGKLIFTMDGDLQDDPNEIPKFLQKMHETNSDLVVGWKYNRLDSLAKTIPSKVFNFLVYYLTGVKLHDTDCGYRLMKKEVAKNLQLYGGLYRFIPVLARKMGYKISEVKVNHRKRSFGQTKYGFSRLFKGSFDLITTKFLTSFSQSPLHFFGFAGFFFTSLGALFGVYLSFIWLLGENIGHRPLLLFSILLIVLGIQFMSMGLIGEMITKQRKEKAYIIKEEFK